MLKNYNINILFFLNHNITIVIIYCFAIYFQIEKFIYYFDESIINEDWKVLPHQNNLQFRGEIMKVDKTISNKFVRVDMTPQEYDAFVQLLKLQRKDYKGGK